MVLSYLQFFPCPSNHGSTRVHCLAALFRGTSDSLCSLVTSRTPIGSTPVTNHRAPIETELHHQADPDRLCLSNYALDLRPSPYCTIEQHDCSLQKQTPEVWKVTIMTKVPLCEVEPHGASLRPPPHTPAVTP
jgi:hypothetical protein